MYGTVLYKHCDSMDQATNPLDLTTSSQVGPSQNVKDHENDPTLTRIYEEGLFRAKVVEHDDVKARHRALPLDCIPPSEGNSSIH